MLEGTRSQPEDLPRSRRRRDLSAQFLGDATSCYARGVLTVVSIER